jgi:hypothetical protein
VISGSISPPEIPDKRVFASMKFSICERRASRSKEDHTFLMGADGITVIHVT